MLCINISVSTVVNHHYQFQRYNIFMLVHSSFNCRWSSFSCRFGRCCLCFNRLRWCPTRKTCCQPSVKTGWATTATFKLKILNHFPYVQCHLLLHLNVHLISILCDNLILGIYLSLLYILFSNYFQHTAGFY